MPVTVRMRSFASGQEGPKVITGPTVNYPNVTFDDKQIPGLGNAKVGKRCTIMVEAELCRLEKGREYGSEDGYRGEFKLLKGAVVDHGSGSIHEAKKAAKSGY